MANLDNSGCMPDLLDFWGEEMTTEETSRARIDHTVRQVWLAYRDASDVNADMLTEQDMELWGVVTRHAAIQDRLNAVMPNDQAQRPEATI